MHHATYDPPDHNRCIQCKGGFLVHGIYVNSSIVYKKGVLVKTSSPTCWGQFIVIRPHDNKVNVFYVISTTKSSKLYCFLDIK